MKTVKIQIDVDYFQIRKHAFRTVKSPYIFTQPIIYEAEFITIREALKHHNVNPLNVKQFMYECGLTKPYGWAGLPTAATAGYRIHILAEISDNVPLKTINETIRDRFMIAKTLQEKKSLYKELIKQYHPDKEGGNLEIAKFINSFKNW